MPFLQVRHIVDRVFSEFLYPTSEQPTRLVLNAGISSSDTSLSYDDSMIMPEELELLDSGQIIEIDSEQIIIREVDEDNNLLSELIRGVNGTTAAAHNTNSFILASPTWTRQSVFNAVADCVSELWPRLYLTSVEEEISIVSYIAEVPEAAQEVLAVYSSVDKYTPINFTFRKYDRGSTTNKSIFVDQTTSPIDIEYKVKPVRPTAESDLLGDLFISEDWSGLIVLGAMLNLLSQPDVERMMTDFIINRMKSESVQVGTGKSIRDGLVQLYEYKISKLINARDVEEHYTDTIQQWHIAGV